ncbi:protein-disulfide reductase DsbD domain-containing protein [Primorskyibacter sp. S87]|uniref:protein-disulfide reductase DsbD domain-containing protein n=1 Tax=Primorskyibacter sp. S87 TaxID=3415126 RepID=UPI003C7B4FB0
MIKSLLSVLALAVPAAVSEANSAFAGGMGDLVRVEVLDGGQTSRGTHLAALRLTLSDGWKTYWRAPGDAGIPPRFDWSRSRNVGELSITWPAPHVFEQNGLRSIGYQNELVLPVEITPSRAGDPVRLRGSVELGVCNEVCVPGTLRFDHDLDAKAGRNPTIVAAMAQRPYSAREAGVRATTCALSPTADGMRIEAHIRMPSAGGEEFAVIEPGNPGLWASETETRRKGDTLIATAEVANDSGTAFALDRSAIRITVLGKKHSVDIRGCTPS